MNQTELIKAIVKVIREDIKKTLKEEIRIAVKEVLNEQIETPKTKVVNEGRQFKSKDDGSWGTINFSQKSINPTTPTITPDMLGYDGNFSEYSKPESIGGLNEEYGSYIQGQEEGGIPLQHKMAMAARKNPEAAQSIMKAMTRDYSQLVKKFNKG